MSLSDEILGKYLNPVFVETGSYLGSSISCAKQVGFKKIISIEISTIFYENVKKLFEIDDNVILLHGDSSVMLLDVIEKISDSITFFLDAHNLEFAGQEAQKLIESGAENWPLMKEIEAIAKHPRKDHIILIDDVQLFKLFGTSVLQMKKILYQINPKYNVYFEPNINEKIMVARL